jgi:hypothetical protein
MGTWPIQADENQLPFSNDSPWKRRPSPLSSRPERSAVEGPAVSFPQYSQPSGLFIARLAA